jgi:hypothetical protein
MKAIDVKDFVFGYMGKNRFSRDFSRAEPGGNPEETRFLLL